MHLLTVSWKFLDCMWDEAVGWDGPNWKGTGVGLVAPIPGKFRALMLHPLWRELQLLIQNYANKENQIYILFDLREIGKENHVSIQVQL